MCDDNSCLMCRSDERDFERAVVEMELDQMAAELREQCRVALSAHFGREF